MSELEFYEILIWPKKWADAGMMPSDDWLQLKCRPKVSFEVRDGVDFAHIERRPKIEKDTES